MHPPARSEDVLYFSCGGCGTELSVPTALHGVEGPCPTCGVSLKAPSLYLPVNPLLPTAPAVHLPPLDRRHDAWQNTESIPVPDWMNRGLEADVVAPLNREPESDSSMAGLRVTEPSHRLRSREAAGFQAKLAIPEMEEPLDDSWQEKHRIQRERMSNARKIDRVAEQVLNSRGFQVARVSLLVATGGLCAGLVLFMKDRNWVLEMPWRPDRPAAMVETPRKPMPPSSQAAPIKPQRPEVDESNPFLVEDSSDLEGQQVPLLTPLPDPVSVPVGATPVRDGKN